jgi:hypothetical protein
MLKPAIPSRITIFSGPAWTGSAKGEVSRVPGSAQLPLDSKKPIAHKKKRDNQHSDRFIEVGTKALRRETDVWGDAAGTAPAVTSVTSLSPSILFQSTINGARLDGAPSFFAFGALTRRISTFFSSGHLFENSKQRIF